MNIPSQSCCCLCWINLFPCCFITEVEKEISHNALNNTEPSLSKSPPPIKVHPTQQAEEAIALDKKLKSKRHAKLASTDMLTAQSVLKMSDIEYQAYMKRNFPGTPRDSQPQTYPLPTSRYKPMTPTMKPQDE